MAVKFLNDQVETALIPECGHLPQAEQPEKTHEIIADFLKKLKI